MTAHTTKIPPHVNHIRLNSPINLHRKTTAHTIIQKYHQTTIIHLFTTTSTYNHTYIVHFLKKKIYHFIHKKPRTN